MAAAPSATIPSKNLTPQVTGFSQAQPRNTAESQGGNMGVFLSWHEKARLDLSSCSSISRHGLLITCSFSQLIEIAGPGSIVRVMSDRRTV
jgi:actin related protein 2/3 complex subunit 5